MELLNQILLVLATMVSLHLEKGWWCHGCLDQERDALLEIKASFNIPTNIPQDIDSNCCNWGMVECNNITGRVMGLNLQYARPYSNSEEMYLNASLFLSFEELKKLDLCENQISGCIKNEGFERLSKLSKLEFLSLRDNNFDNTILSSLSGISSLKFLDMSDNRLKGIFDFRELGGLSSLEELDLSYNKINRVIASTGLYELKHLQWLRMSNNDVTGFERVSKISNLEFLDLSFNKLNNTILSSLKGLSSLKYLDMDTIGLKDLLISKLYISNWFCPSIQLLELDGFSKLEELVLSGNEINRVIASTEDHNLRNLSALVLDEVATNGRQLQLPSFQAFPNLQAISVINNNFEGIIFGPELQNSTNVEELFLDGSSLDESSFQSLEALPSLKRLSMGWLNGNLPSQGIPNLKNLEHLYLSYSTVENSFMKMVGMLTSLKTLSMEFCSLNGTLPRVQGICDLKHLQELRMNNNDITGSLPSCFANLMSLKLLDLSSNRFAGIISPIVNLTSLKVLDLSSNHFIGNIYPIANLTSLKELDLSSNNFIGNIYSIARLTSIQLLLISENNFQVPFSLGSFFNHSKLKTLEAQNNEIYVEREEINNLNPKFQLQQLILSSDKVLYAKEFPEFLHHQHDLQYFELSYIRISGSGFPYWLLENNANLYELHLVDSSLSGPLLLPNLSHKHLSTLDISGNSFDGHILEEIGTIFQSLEFLNMAGNTFSGNIPSSMGEIHWLRSLNMSQNAFTGSIPSSVGKMKLLLSLDLSHNRLSGRIPESLGCSSLLQLVLSNNSLEGQIFSKNFNLQALEILLLDDNNFTGDIPNSLLNSSLVQLDARNNSLSGKIPLWMANMTSLQGLDLSHNHIPGNLLSNCFPPSVTEVYLSNNQLQGSFADALANCSQLETIHLTHNYFTGRIPEWIGDFSQLNFLLLGHNDLEGEIPNQLCTLKQLRAIDLSNNNLYGHILPCLRTSSSSEHLQIVVDYEKINRTMVHYFDFTTKSRSYSYKRQVLILFSGIDLSCNYFVGEIPPAIGNLNSIKVLNLSHNRLTGSIPSTFSNLSQIESLDISYNKLDGQIPPQLVGLFSLSSFSVAHNNLSGKIPERVAQFATFDKDSYEGNPFLCGLPLPSCIELERNSTNDIIERDNSFIDMEIFYVSFIVSYIIVLMGIAAILFINPYWRRR